MWSYEQTITASVAQTSSSSFTGTSFTTSTNNTLVGTRTTSVTRDGGGTRSEIASFISANTSRTYRNPTNTTQTLTTTYASFWGIFFETRSTSDVTQTPAVTTAGNPTIPGGSTTEKTFSSSQSEIGSRSTSFGQSSRIESNAFSAPISFTGTVFATRSATTQLTLELIISNSSSVSGGTIFITRSTITHSTLIGINGTTTATSSIVNSTSSLTTTSLWNSSFGYSSTTATFTTTANGQTTASTSASYSFLSSTSSSSGTVTFSVSTSQSTSYSLVTSATTTESITSTSYVTSSFELPCIINTIVEFNTNEWGWSVSAGGSNRAEAIAASFTRTTFSATLGVTTQTFPTVTITGGAQTITFTQTTYSSGTITSTRSSTTTSTYRVASFGTDTPFTNTTHVATISHTRTTATTFTYSSASGTRTTTFTTVSDTAATTVGSFTDTVTTTFSGGTSLSTNSYTRTTSNQIITVSSRLSITQGISLVSVLAALTYVRDSSTAAAVPTIRQVTIGEGWQGTTFGREQPIGTNLSSGTTSTVSESATAWPSSVVRIQLGDRDAVALAGTVPQSLENTRTTSKAGGFGWLSTFTTTMTQTIGVHHGTTVNSSTSGTFDKTWTPASSTFSFGPGVAVAVEPVPLVNSTSSSNGDNQFLSFAAFPST